MIRTVRYLFSRGADPKHMSQRGITVLHYAVAKGDVDMIKLMLEKGVSVCKYQAGRNRRRPEIRGRHHGFEDSQVQSVATDPKIVAAGGCQRIISLSLLR